MRVSIMTVWIVDSHLLIPAGDWVSRCYQDGYRDGFEKGQADRAEKDTYLASVSN